MKKIVLLNLTIIFVILSLFYGFIAFPHKSDNEVSFRINAENEFEILDESWKTFHMRGVNMGTGYPDLFPNEFGIDKETYFKWFCQIGEMNGNTVRAYKIQSPEFYEALSEYNKEHKRKIYLLQGINFKESFMDTNHNVLDKEFLSEEIYDEVNKTIKAVHGDLIDFGERYLTVYKDDVSDYLVGYTLGIEWDNIFVNYTNKINEGMEPFSGKYFYCDKNAEPFENFLAGWGNYVLEYEGRRYNKQSLISFCNWTETDPLINEVVIQRENEKMPDQDTRSEVTINMNTIHQSENVKGGLFASYNIYPYYPLFLQYGRYTEYIDEKGQSNPYRKYLSEIVRFHKCPVVITEYGVPSSRNRTYSDNIRGFSHGGLNEKEQGEAIKTLYEDINKAGCSGSFIFTWQDEWYKRTWNELVISDSDGRRKWSNAQCVEQSFGLLSFEPGDKASACYPDGNYSEWEKTDMIYDNGEIRTKIRQDVRYLHLYVEGTDQRKGKNKINLAFDITPESGRKKQGIHNFETPVDFILKIRDEEDGKLYVDTEYDISVYSMFDKMASNININKHRKNREFYGELGAKYNLDDNFKLVMRAGGDIEGYRKNRYSLVEAGNFIHGNGNPENRDFNSNADYFIHENSIEIRIPWQLLNFTNPAQGKIAGNLEKNGNEIHNKKIKEIKIAAYYDDDNEINDFASYKLKKWDKPEFHERLKSSYYIIQNLFRSEAYGN